MTVYDALALANTGAAQGGPLGWLYAQSYDVRMLLCGQLPPPPTVTAPAGSVTLTATTNGGDLKGYIAAQPAGTVFWFTPGETFRLRSLGFANGDTGIIAKTGDQFRSDPANPAVLLGSEDISTGWAGAGPYTRTYTGSQVTQQGVAGSTSVCSSGTICTYPDDIYLDGQQQLRVASAAGIAAGQYHIDYTTDVITIGSDPAGKTVDIATVRFAIAGATSVAAATAANNVTVEGLTVRRFANTTQHGAVASTEQGTGWTIRYVLAEQNHAAGISVGNGWLVEWCRLEYNGQLGIKVLNPITGPPPNPTGIVFRYNRLVGNKLHGMAAGYKSGWEGGGSKFGRLSGVTIEYNYTADNYGSALWLDVACQNSQIRYNVCYQDHWDGGVHDEVSYDSELHHNLMVRCGDLDTRGNGGWPWGGGIEISTSMRVNCHHNTVVDCRGSIGFIQQSREGDVVYARTAVGALVLSTDPTAVPRRITGSQCNDNTVVLRSRDYGGASGVRQQMFGAVNDYTPAGHDMYAGGLVFLRNKFWVDLTAAAFKFAGTSRTGSTWQSTYPAYVSGNTFADVSGWPADSRWLPVGMAESVAGGGASTLTLETGDVLITESGDLITV